MQKFEKIVITVVIITIFSFLTSFAAEGNIKLSAPDKKGGKPLMTVLSDRKSGRNYVAGKQLTQNQLSNLLWAAQGVNRPDGRLTSPTARNWQEIDLYAVMESGTYLYNREKHSLDLKSKEDLRKYAAKQEFAQKAPLILVYVVNYGKMTGADEESKKRFSSVDCGFIGQNIYLYCASEGLSTVFLGMVDTKGMGRVLKLDHNFEVLFSQTIGVPAK